MEKRNASTSTNNNDLVYPTNSFTMTKQEDENLYYVCTNMLTTYIFMRGQSTYLST